MKCDNCKEDKDMWTELFPIRVGGHKNDPRNIYLCKDCRDDRDFHLNMDKARSEI